MLMVIAVFKINAQNYQINFTGTGAGTTVDSVKVENLSQCTALTFGGSDTLILASSVGINEELNPNNYQINIYPNPSPGNCSVEFEAKSAGNVHIAVYDISGKLAMQKK